MQAQKGRKMGKEEFLTPLNVKLPKPIYLGAHLSISGGLYKAIDSAIDLGATALQIFTKNQRQWTAPPLKEEEIKKFKESWKRWGEYPVFAHVSYLLNLASPKKDMQNKSVEGFAVELKRAESLGIKYLVTHLGSHMGDEEKQALKRFAQNLDTAIEKSETKKVKILLETTAGQGTNLGYDFKHLRLVMDHSKHPERLGVCFDTCHAFAAGYEIRDVDNFEKTFETLDKEVGLKILFLIHLNDSKHKLGSRKDRHEHIGKGEIGIEGFKNIMTHPLTYSIPKVLETPKGKTLLEDRKNIDRLMRLIINF